MAGTYPDVPGYRFAYDKDGTNITWYNLNNGTNGAISASDLTKINSDQLTSYVNPGFGSPYTFIILFPEPRDLIGILINTNAGTFNTGTLDWSNDTTTGLDGTWTTIGNMADIGVGTTLKPDLRTIYPLSVTSVTAIRFNNIYKYAGSNFRNIHIYGSISVTNSPDRLRIVDLSGNDIAAQLDFGDIKQRNNVTKQFQVVNNSSTLTANNITVTLDVPTDASPTLVGQYQLSTDNTAYANAINIGTLAPGASSGTLYVRDTVAATAQLSVWSLRLIATANTWS